MDSNATVQLIEEIRFRTAGGKIAWRDISVAAPSYDLNAARAYVGDAGPLALTLTDSAPEGTSLLIEAADTGQTLRRLNSRSHLVSVAEAEALKRLVADVQAAVKIDLEERDQVILDMLREKRPA